MKRCNQCHIEKELSFFDKEKETRDGYRNQCKGCRETYRKAHRAKNKEIWNSYMREYRKEHSGSRRWKEKAKSRSLKFRYGITLDEYNQMVLAQEGKCKICSKIPTGKYPLVVDHCHNSNKVRGLLCGGCNAAIAILDNPDLLSKALAYLK